MALELGPPQSDEELDLFLAREGYERRKRLYREVIGCWCGSSRLTPLPPTSEPLRFYQLCEGCGCLILRNVLSSDDLTELYGPTYFREHQVAIGLPPIDQRYSLDARDRIPVWIHLLSQYYTSGRILEIGCSHGRFLKELSTLGYHAVGIEMDREVSSWAKLQTGCDIRCADVKHMDSGSFDAVFANDVLEHVYDPRTLIAQVMRVVKPEGKAFFQTVMFDNWQDCRVEMMRPLFHTVLYSKRCLSLLEDEVSALHDVIPSVFGSFFLVFSRRSI